MTFEFDHLFICTDEGAAIADRLITLGLIEGSSNVHPGQGTANRRFFFHNAMLELLWVQDRQEVRSPAIQRSRLWERWENRASGICPVGICLRPGNSDGAIAAHQEAAFSSWAYSPPYLPDTVSIAVGTNSDRLTEPMLFQIPFGRRPDQLPPEKAQPIDHPLGLREITRVELVGPLGGGISAEWRSVLDTQQVQWRRGDDYWIELGFDGETQGERIDLRSEFPLVLSW